MHKQILIILITMQTMYLCLCFGAIKVFFLFTHSRSSYVFCATLLNHPIYFDQGRWGISAKLSVGWDRLTKCMGYKIQGLLCTHVRVQFDHPRLNWISPSKVPTTDALLIAADKRIIVLPLFQLIVKAIHLCSELIRKKSS